MDDKKLQAPPLSLLDRYRGQAFQPLYTTSVTVTGGETGHGRASGVVRSDDGSLASICACPPNSAARAAAPIPNSCSPPATPRAFTAR